MDCWVVRPVWGSWVCFREVYAMTLTDRQIEQVNGVCAELMRRYSISVWPEELYLFLVRFHGDDAFASSRLMVCVASLGFDPKPRDEIDDLAADFLEDQQDRIGG